MDAGPRPAVEPRRRWLLPALLLLALGVRILAFLPFREVDTLRGDEGYYVRTAQALAAGEGHPGSFRPPLYSAFLALPLQASGGNLDAARGLQVLVSLLTVAGVFSICRRRFGELAAVASALACALTPALVHYTHFLWSEGLAAALIVLVFWLLDRYTVGERLVWIGAAGVALGLTALTKEIWLFFGAAIVAWLLYRQGARWRKALPAALLLAAGLLLTVLPWTVRNTRLHDELVVISTCRWFPIAVGNLLPEERWFSGQGRGGEYRRALPSGLSELEQEEYWRDIALDAILAEQPVWLFKKLARNGARLVSVHSQTVRFLENGWLPSISRATATVLLTTEVAGYLAVMALALLGLWLVPDRELKPLVVLALLLTAGVHVLANAIPRFHVPVLPLLCLYAGPAAVSWRRWRDLPRWRQAGAAATLTLFFVLILSRWNLSLETAWQAARSLP